MRPIFPIISIGAHSFHRRGAILLEVVMAITLFFITAAVITGSMNVSFLAAKNMRNQALAEDLAVTKVSELQMGLLPVVDAGPNTYDEDPNLDGWTWQVAATQMDEQTITQGPQLKRVEVTIRHDPSSLVQRLVIFLPATDETAPASQPAGPAGGSSATGGGG